MTRRKGGAPRARAARGVGGVCELESAGWVKQGWRAGWSEEEVVSPRFWNAWSARSPCSGGVDLQR